MKKKHVDVTLAMCRCIGLFNELSSTRTHQEMRDSEREPFYDDIARTYFKILKKLYRLWDSNPRP